MNFHVMHIRIPRTRCGRKFSFMTHLDKILKLNDDDPIKISWSHWFF